MTEEESEAEAWNKSYDGPMPWDIGRAQPEFIALEAQGEIRGRVLDVGCGTGDNSVHMAIRGHSVVGVDFAKKAVARARAKAETSGVKVEFIEADALALGALRRSFDTIIDSNLFHVFADEERPRFAASLAAAAAPAAVYHLLCFSENEPGGWGPRRVTQAEIRAVFATGWTVERIRPAGIDTGLGGAKVLGWLATIRRG